jgi:hypothetical protein
MWRLKNGSSEKVQVMQRWHVEFTPSGSFRRVSVVEAHTAEEAINQVVQLSDRSSAG